MPSLLADFIQPRVCNPICAKLWICCEAERKKTESVIWSQVGVPASGVGLWVLSESQTAEREVKVSYLQNTIMEF